MSDAFLDSFDDVIDLEIENFEVVFDEVDELNDEMIDEMIDKILSLSLLKFRLEASLIIFFAWCWRTCSCNLLFDSKTSSHCLQTTFLQID